MQISGRAFQMSFRDRKIPFNVHGVAFYRKKVAGARPFQAYRIIDLELEE